METRAHYVTVGAFVLVLLCGLVGAVIWLAKWQSDRQFARYDIIFTGSVQGIRRGSGVNYLGIGVGQAVDIRIEDVNQVRVTIELGGSTPIREGTRASVETQGFTGGAIIRLRPGPPSAPPLVAKAGERYPVIPSERGRLEQLFDDAPLLVSRVDALIARLSMLVSDENLGYVTETLKGIAATSTSVSQTAPTLDKASRDIAALVASARTTTERVEKLTAHLDGDLRRITDQTAKTIAKADAVVGELRNTAKSATGVADGARRLLDDNRGPINDFANNGLYEISNLAAELRELITVLKRVTAEVERDPARFFFGRRQDGFNAK